MDTNIVIALIQFLAVILTFVSIALLYKTIKENKNLNQNMLFNEVVKQERELRIKLWDYRIEMEKMPANSRRFKEKTLDYDTLLFNYYEYLAICLYKNLIGEKEAKLYFKELLINIKELFEKSILFKEGYATKEQYKGIQWLFKKWGV